MGQYHKLINLTKKEYVNPHKIGLGAKHLEGIGFEGSMGDVMYLLSIAQGNERRGGGDVEGHRYIGRWAGDKVVVVGDYYDQDNDNPKFKGLYDINDGVHENVHWHDISHGVRELLSKVMGVKFKENTYTTKELNGDEYQTTHWNRI